MSVSRLSLPVAAALVLGALLPAAAQTPVRVRGTIEAVDGGNYTIKARDGSDVKIHLVDKPRITALVKSTIEDIKPDSYIGIVSVTGADGQQHATSVHIFPAAMRGTNEGQFAWDTGPKNLMTNGAVRTKVSAKEGPLLTLNVKDEEKKVVIDPTTPVVSFVPGTAEDLKVGAHVIVLNATRLADGGLETAAINVGRDLTPAM
jgi:hypothetical protein